MSKHTNEKASAPTSSQKKIRGAGATYRASVQKESRSTSSTKSAGSGKVEKVSGQGSAPSGKLVNQPNVGGFGSGHYEANKG